MQSSGSNWLPFQPPNGKWRGKERENGRWTGKITVIYYKASLESYFLTRFFFLFVSFLSSYYCFNPQLFCVAFHFLLKFIFMLLLGDKRTNQLLGARQTSQGFDQTSYLSFIYDLIRGGMCPLTEELYVGKRGKGVHKNRTLSVWGSCWRLLACHMTPLSTNIELFSPT